MRLAIGDKVALKSNREPWYSQHTIAVGEIGTVTAVNVPVVRRVDGRNSYHVALFDGRQVDFNNGEFVRVSA